MYLDCIHVKARDNHVIINKAVYLAIGVNMEGKKELLGIWIGKNKVCKFWMQVVTELKNRGVAQIYVACVDGLKGFPEAINSIFPKTIVQLCIVHMVRNSVKYVSYTDLKAVTADLKAVYSAINEAEGLRELQNFAKKWDEKYPVIFDIWQRNWSGIAHFLAFRKTLGRRFTLLMLLNPLTVKFVKLLKIKEYFQMTNRFRK